MEIGICAWSFSGACQESGQELDPHSPEGLIDLARTHGLASIECAGESLAARAPEAQKQLRSELESEDISIFLDTGSDRYAEDLSPLIRCLEVAHAVGARVVRTTVSRMLEGDRTHLGRAGVQTYLKSLVTPLQEAMARAEELDIDVGIENHQDLCSEELMWLCDQVGSDRLGVTMDCGNAYAVGETPERFARTVLPRLKHVHIKDYTAHPSEHGYRLKRCAIGAGIVDWPALLKQLAVVKELQATIELGATSARHVRIFEEDWWATYPPERPFEVRLAALRDLHCAARPREEDWRTPHEREAPAADCARYELEQFEASVAYLKLIRPVPGNP